MDSLFYTPRAREANPLRSGSKQTWVRNSGRGGVENRATGAEVCFELDRRGAAPPARVVERREAIGTCLCFYTFPALALATHSPSGRIVFNSSLNTFQILFWILSEYQKVKLALECSVEGPPRQQGGMAICKNTGTSLCLPISTPPELVRRPPYGPLQSKPRPQKLGSQHPPRLEFRPQVCFEALRIGSASRAQGSRKRKP